MIDIPDDIMETAREAVRMRPDTQPFAIVIARAILAERERCRMIRPEPDITEATDAYSDGYTEGFADACARFRAAIDPSIWYGDTRPRAEIPRDQRLLRQSGEGY